MPAPGPMGWRRRDSGAGRPDGRWYVPVRGIGAPASGPAFAVVDAARRAARYMLKGQAWRVDRMAQQQDLPLPASAVDALARGHAVEAAKIVRDRLGLSLEDAHALVQRHAARVGGRHRAPTDERQGAEPVNTGEFVFPQQAADAMARGELLEAIHALRSANRHLDLKTAKEAIERYRDTGSMAIPATKKLPQSTRVPTVVEGDRGGARSLLVAVFIVLAAVAWWLFGHG